MNHRGAQVIWYVLGIIETLLAFRFVLKLLAANPAANFTVFMYNVTYPFVSPFQSVFHSTPVVGAGVFDWTIVLAMFVYWVVAIGIVELFFIGKRVPHSEMVN